MSTTESVEATTIAPSEEPAAHGYEFDQTFQDKIVALSMRDTIFAQRTEGLIKPEFLHNELDRVLVKTIQDFYGVYKKVPDKTSVMSVLRDAISAGKIPMALVPDIKPRMRFILKTPIVDRDYIADQCANFAKSQAMQNAIMDSVKELGKNPSKIDYSKIEKLFKGALQVGINDDGDFYDYWGEIDNRTAERVAIAAGTLKPDGITTGFKEIDDVLYHGGWGRKELVAIMARAKFGKSMGLGEFGKYASLAGHNVLIVTLEVGAKIYADRIDANLADTAMKALKTTPFDVRAKIKAAEAKAGQIMINGFPSGTLKPSQLRRLIERYRMRGIIFDLIICDYADLMAPEFLSGIPREDSRMIWTELRAIAHEQNAAVLTATQTNRSGAKAMTASATDVAEDYNKIRIADLVISGNASEAEVAAGEARLYFAASRNQEGEFVLNIQQDRSKMKFITKILGKGGHT